MATAQKRAIAYIDGFNLHFGLLQRGWSKYLWLDLTKFAAALLLPDQALVHTKYFTSRISKPVSKQRLQSNFIDALNTLAEFSIYYGRYQAEVRTCENCGFNAIITNEKKTDVNIATELLIDAFHDKFDAAILVTADADLTAPIVAIRKLFPEKSVVVAFPPKRHSYELRNAASSAYHIGENKFRRNLLPEKVVTPSGFILQRPNKWK
jgi:uncharacterized LabA/DUF88 family protein